MIDPLGLDADDVAAIGAHRLRFGERRFRGRSGARRGRGAGSSLDFLDLRDYVPGDDVRHLDWRGYARTEQMRVRLHEEEVAPFVDIVVDTSASLAVTPAKHRAVRALAAAFAEWAGAAGSTTRLLALGGGRLSLDQLAFTAPGGTPTAPLVPLRRGGACVLLTDGLWSDDPAPLLHTLLGAATRFLCLQLLDPWEREPAVGAACQLVDCELGTHAELLLDARTVAAYRERLQRLCERLRALVVGGGGTFVGVTAAPLRVLCERDLVPSGVVEPA